MIEQSKVGCTTATAGRHEVGLRCAVYALQVSSAKEEADRKAKSIRDQNRERAKMAGIGGGGGMEGIGSGPVGGSESFGNSGYGGDSSRYSDPNPGFGEPYSMATPTPEPEAPKVAKGMKLGGGSKKQQMMDKLVSEDNLTPLPSSAASTTSAAEVMLAVRLFPPVLRLTMLLGFCALPCRSPLFQPRAFRSRLSWKKKLMPHSPAKELWRPLTSRAQCPLPPRTTRPASAGSSWQAKRALRSTFQCTRKSTRKGLKIMGS